MTYDLYNREGDREDTEERERGDSGERETVVRGRQW